MTEISPFKGFPCRALFSQLELDPRVLSEESKASVLNHFDFQQPLQCVVILTAILGASLRQSQDAPQAAAGIFRILADLGARADILGGFELTSNLFQLILQSLAQHFVQLQLWQDSKHLWRRLGFFLIYLAIEFESLDPSIMDSPIIPK
jgi:hypothetical protein